MEVPLLQVAQAAQVLFHLVGLGVADGLLLVAISTVPATALDSRTPLIRRRSTGPSPCA